MRKRDLKEKDMKPKTERIDEKNFLILHFDVSRFMKPKQRNKAMKQRDKNKEAKESKKRRRKEERKEQEGNRERERVKKGS